MPLGPGDSAHGDLTVAPSEGWRYLGKPIADQPSRLWSLSDEVRNGFGENVVESWGSSVSTASPDRVLQDFRRACASLPRWEEVLAITWQEGSVTYGAVSGTAVVADEGIESSSIIALRTSTVEISARHVVVTTFSDNHDRHRQSRRNIRTKNMSLETMFDD